MKTVFVGISGGVDSFYAAKFLLEKGYNVKGYFFDNGYFDSSKAFEVCKNLNIPFIVVKIEKIFKKDIIDYFKQYYLEGKTPNPCAMCNKHIKFGYLLEYALQKGADYVSTGHYVRIENNFLKKALDTTKDQSYFLSLVKKEFLKYLIMPLGTTVKKEIKPKGYKESQDICFIKKNYKEILPHVKNGYFLDKNGNILGENKGYTNYTIGQRKGLGSFGERMYVTSIDAKTGNVVLGKYEDTLNNIVNLKKVNLFKDIEIGKEYSVKLRYNQKAISCTFINEKTLKLQNLSQVVPGQIATVYENDKVILGAEIS
jgi:tRNA-specific 2-thiouridylase